MVWWIVAGVLLLAVAILAAAVMSVLGRVAPLQRAQRRLNRRLEQAVALQSAVEGLRDKALGVASAAERAAARRTGTRDAEPSPTGGRVPPRRPASRMKRSG